jgi:hypothetical protein
VISGLGAGSLPKDIHGLANSTALIFTSTCPRQGEQLDWGTLVFNSSKVRNFLIANASSGSININRWSAVDAVA